MKALVVTGSSGVIGTVLGEGLAHNITPFDLPSCDARDYGQLKERVQGHDAIVHLAWETKTDNCSSGRLNPDNVLQTYNVYEVARELGIGRVIMASSVHADKFTGCDAGILLNPYDVPVPDSPYGASKVMVEALGRYYSDALDLDVFCIRFGGVNRANQPPQSPASERAVWLSHRDCTRLVGACLEAEVTPGRFEIIYGVSDNASRIHDVSNSVGWVPLDGCK